MKKLYTAIFVLLGAILFQGCETAEIQPYSLDEECVNFWPSAKGASVTSLLTQTLSLNTYANNKADLDSLNANVAIQIQGRMRDYNRKVTIKVGEVLEGVDITLPQTEYIIPAGEGRIEMPITFFFYDGLVPRGKMSKFTLVFDYDKTDFEPGMVDFQTMTFTVDNRWTYSSFNISENTWKGDLYEYGSWSGTKSEFMVKYFGTYNFFGIPYGSGATVLNHVSKLRALLAEYKTNSAADPVTYPPLYDETKDGEVWISF